MNSLTVRSVQQRSHARQIHFLEKDRIASEEGFFFTVEVALQNSGVLQCHRPFSMEDSCRGFAS